MSRYIQISFHEIEPEQLEILVAYLADAGFEGFEEEQQVLKAFISEANYDKQLLLEIAHKYNLNYDEQIIGEQNWNTLWESNFPPVIVDDFVVVRADFHEPIPGVEHEIIITPKMSFGTGHHATTFMMMQQIREIDFRNKTVLDFGTGTGVLAILAEKLGAKKVVAIDIDEWSIANALENCARNECSAIQIIQSDTVKVDDTFDIILANINKNVIVGNFPELVAKLTTGGVILFSGLLHEDEKDIRALSEKYLLVFAGSYKKDNWLCLKFIGNQ
jgi:ribosomal protein L11 methyltransferase